MSRLSSKSFIQSIKRFDAFGTNTLVENEAGVNYYINEYWTAKQRQGHSIHEVSYRACFKPQLPAFFISQLTQMMDVVYDPFMGRGTTPVEAAIAGRVPYGNDINPLSRALTAPRLCPPTINQVKERLASIPWSSFQHSAHRELEVFYHPQTLIHIEGLRNWLLQKEHAGTMDGVDRWIRMVAINRLTGHSPGFFSVYTLPPNQAVTVERQAIINEKRQQIPPVRDVPAIILKKSKSLLADPPPQVETASLSAEQSDRTSHIADASVQLVVTSPPFLDIVDYEGDNWLRCWFLGVDPRTVPISHCRTVQAWEAFTRSTLTELVRVVKPGGHIAYEVGEVRNGKVKLEQHVLEASKGLALKPLGVMINQQDFTKTANCWGVTNNTAGTNTNRIVLFERQ